jgi:hypothetical protein
MAALDRDRALIARSWGQGARIFCASAHVHGRVYATAAHANSIRQTGQVQQALGSSHLVQAGTPLAADADADADAAGPHPPSRAGQQRPAVPGEPLPPRSVRPRPRRSNTLTGAQAARTGTAIMELGGSDAAGVQQQQQQQQQQYAPRPVHTASVRGIVRSITYSESSGSFKVVRLQVRAVCMCCAVLHCGV